MVKVVYIGSDHGGFGYKEELKSFLKERGFNIEDMGAFTVDPADDYPDFVIPVAQKVAANLESLGIVLGRSGNGEAMVANKVPGIRAAVCLNEEMAKKTRDHNNANILSLGSDYITLEEAKKTVIAFLETPFSNDDRHIRRLEKMASLEK